MGRRPSKEQYQQTLQFALKKANIQFSYFDRGSIQKQSNLPEYYFIRVLNTFIENGWKMQRHLRSNATPEMERWGLDHVVGILHSDEFFDLYDLVSHPISKQQIEIMRRELKNYGWKYDPGGAYQQQKVA